MSSAFVMLCACKIGTTTSLSAVFIRVNACLSTCAHWILQLTCSSGWLSLYLCSLDTTIDVFLYNVFLSEELLCLTK